MEKILRWCYKCDKEVNTVEKMFHTVICEECGQILSSDISADKVVR